MPRCFRAGAWARTGGGEPAAPHARWRKPCRTGRPSRRSGRGTLNANARSSARFQRDAAFARKGPAPPPRTSRAGCRRRPRTRPSHKAAGMVGQLEKSLMPWRTSGSASTSTALNLTPEMGKNLHRHGGKAALREYRRALHVEQHVIVLHIFGDAGLDSRRLDIGHGTDPLESRPDLSTARPRVKKAS